MRLPLVLALAILAFTGCATQPKAEAPAEISVLWVRVDHGGCQQPRQCEKWDTLEVSMEGQGELGWPVSVHLLKKGKDPLDHRWKAFEVQPGVRVAISAFAPPHPVAEKWFQTSMAREQRVVIKLAPKEQMRTVNIDVVLPPNSPWWADGFAVDLTAKKTGHTLDYLPVSKARKGLSIPRGDYAVEVRGKLAGGCLNEAPRAERFVPYKSALQMEEEATTTLRPQLGSTLLLHAVNPRTQGDAAGLGSLRPRNKSSHFVIEKRYAGAREDWVRARLVSLKDGAVYDLEWGWTGLNYDISHYRFPMGQDAYQLNPVPFGKYEFILRGTGIRELTQVITLGPGETTTLRVTPEALAFED